MKVIGLTGKTGAGKTTISAVLKEKGCFVIDGDIVARNVTEKGSECLKALCKVFGNEIVDENGELIRAELAKRAFKDEDSTAVLNSTTHPFIKSNFISQLELAKANGYKTAIIDAAALLESDCKELCSTIIVVTAPEVIRLQRAMERDGISKERILERMRAQKADEYYFSQADVIFRNFPPYDKDENEWLKIFSVIE